jgi:hypothetical protein
VECHNVWVGKVVKVKLKNAFTWRCSCGVEFVANVDELIWGTASCLYCGALWRLIRPQAQNEEELYLESVRPPKH